MKHCPQCRRTYTDETLQFCRDDGTLLISDASVSDDSSATRILPASQTGEAGPARDLQTAAAQGQGTTSALEATVNAASQTGELKAPRAVSSNGKLVSNTRSRKAVAGVALAVLVIALGIAGYFYFTRSSRAAIDSIAVLPFANTSGDPNTEYLYNYCQPRPELLPERSQQKTGAPEIRIGIDSTGCRNRQSGGSSESDLSS